LGEAQCEYCGRFKPSVLSILVNRFAGLKSGVLRADRKGGDVVRCIGRAQGPNLRSQVYLIKSVAFCQFLEISGEDRRLNESET
jgi:hypothetical protein